MYQDFTDHRWKNADLAKATTNRDPICRDSPVYIVLDDLFINGRIFASKTAFNWTDTVRVVQQLQSNASATATPPHGRPDPNAQRANSRAVKQTIWAKDRPKAIHTDCRGGS